MRILWIVNSVFPAPAEALGLPVPVKGGWMYGLAEQLASQNHIHLAVAACCSIKVVRKDIIEGITYYTIPFKNHSRYPKELEPYWKKVCDEFRPDIIHIYGTEYPRALACINVVPQPEYLISIQGLTRVIARYQFSGIKIFDVLKNVTFRDVLRLDTLFHAKRRREYYGKYEYQYFSKVKHVDGRTKWDYAHVKAINNNINYHCCNRSLRNAFYAANKWDIGLVKKHTIFLSQSERPIKGLHQLLEAVAMIKQYFPEVLIKVAGNDITKSKTLTDKLKISGYGSYIKRKINNLGLHNNIQFLGLLTEDEMIKQYKQAHVFVSPSSIENSPNSVGEAQIIGTPVIASYVGGTPDMVTHNETGLLYRFEEVEMLAHVIRKVFTNNDLAAHLSKNAIAAAEKRHDRATNLNRLLEIYRSISK